ncbi:MAG: xanthine dehydrogenase family protein molybdopterin-binding subunit, partial [Hyphomicrobiaceae bacterium]
MRKEDLRLVKGAGSFTDNIAVEGALWASFVRSPHAHADIGGFDTAAAMAIAGARLVITGADWQAAGLGAIPVQRRLTDSEGNPPKAAPWTVLAADRARHVGMPVAVCVAETKAEAEAMADAVEVDWRPRAAAPTLASALADGAPELWQSAPGNIAFHWTLGDKAATERAFAEADHIVEVRRVSQRLVIVPMEPRSAIARYDGAAGHYKLHTGNQGVAIVRDQAAEALGIDKHSLAVTTLDVGGGFGIRSGCYPEYPALLHAARVLGEPVRWTASRTEAFHSDAQARDSDMVGRLALDSAGRFLALDVKTHVAMGACIHHTGYFIATANLSRCLPGPYRIPAVHSDVTCVFTNSVPTAPYRGAGRPEAAYIVESLVEAAAAKLGLDSVDLRRRNLLGPEEMPHVTAVGMRYCSGDFPDLLDRALVASDWAGLGQRKAASRSSGRLRGGGVGMFVEISGGVPNERAKMRLKPGGVVQVRTTLGATGQGHETIFAMLADEQLGIGADNIVLAPADRTGFEDGGGASASRSTQMAGLAIRQSALDLIAELKAKAAHGFGVDAASVD